MSLINVKEGYYGVGFAAILLAFGSAGCSGGSCGGASSLGAGEYCYTDSNGTQYISEESFDHSSFLRDASASTHNPSAVSGNGFSSSAGTRSKDVDFQRAELQQQDRDSRAQALAVHYQMDVDSARQLTLLADRMRMLVARGQLTREDRSALATSALGVVGISRADVQAAAVNDIQNGDRAGINRLIEQAANKLGMPSSTALRNEILPSLGITVPVAD